MATFTWNPEYGASVEKKPNVRAIKFGDGYEQRSKDGINNDPAKWSLQFNMRDDVETAAIMTFLNARAGYEAFYWTPPNESTQIHVVCRTWNKTLNKFNLNSISATFEQVFEP